MAFFKNFLSKIIVNYLDKRVKNIFIFALLAFFMLLNIYCLPIFYNFQEKYFDKHLPLPFKYIVNTSMCKIPNIEATSPDVKKYVFKLKPLKCNRYPLLSFVDKNVNGTFLNIEEKYAKLYAPKLDCCMMNITRIVSYSPENDIRYSSCIFFEKKIRIYTDTVKVVCKDLGKREVYKNVHITAIPKSYSESSKFSVLLIGIDSVSRPAFIRTMPKTYKYVKENYLDLKGYNKVGVNTLPNLGAILTGKSKREIMKSCRFNDRKLDNCTFIWNTFKSENFVTGYMEDQSQISTFNLESPGFLEAPTDFYGRPYILAAENLGVKFYSGLDYCTGPENTGERVMNAAKDFSVTYRNNKYFGLFWMNSFSHDDINLPCTMDDGVVDFLSDKNFVDSTQDTFVIFFSDHGFRFGDFRFTYTGWLEERMPFMFIKIPDRFKKNHIEKFRNIAINSGRLTNPYDVYLMLQDILKIGHKNYSVVKSEACPNCYSLFEEIPENRTCLEAAIEANMCICTGYSPTSINQDFIKHYSSFVVNYINSILKNSLPITALCSLYRIKRIYSAATSDSFQLQHESVHYVLLIIETIPAAMFEATLQVSDVSGDVQLLGEINRLNKYAPESYCVEGKQLKQYCHCMSKIDVWKNYLLSFFHS